MKIRIKHNETEIVVDDVAIGKDHGLIYYNQKYVIELIKEITDNIIKLQGGKNENGII
jgi:hypothetical protein